MNEEVPQPPLNPDTDIDISIKQFKYFCHNIGNVKEKIVYLDPILPYEYNLLSKSTSNDNLFKNDFLGDYFNIKALKENLRIKYIEICNAYAKENNVLYNPTNNSLTIKGKNMSSKEFDEFKNSYVNALGKLNLIDKLNREIIGLIKTGPFQYDDLENLIQNLSIINKCENIQSFLQSKYQLNSNNIIIPIYDKLRTIITENSIKVDTNIILKKASSNAKITTSNRVRNTIKSGTKRISDILSRFKSKNTVPNTPVAKIISPNKQAKINEAGKYAAKMSLLQGGGSKSRRTRRNKRTRRTRR